MDCQATLKEDYAQVSFNLTPQTTFKHITFYVRMRSRDIESQYPWEPNAHYALAYKGTWSAEADTEESILTSPTLEGLLEQLQKEKGPLATSIHTLLVQEKSAINDSIHYAHNLWSGHHWLLLMGWSARHNSIVYTNPDKPQVQIKMQPKGWLLTYVEDRGDDAKWLKFADYPWELNFDE